MQVTTDCSDTCFQYLRFNLHDITNQAGHNFLHIKTKTFPGMKFCSKFALSYLEIIVKGQLFRIDRSHFFKSLFRPEKFTGLSRNGPLV